MANRRMFSKSITSSSRFLMMPQSAQNLYFHLGMNADDDGFCEHFTIMRMTESKPDDLKILQVKGFIRIFDDRVLIITDWKENNYIQKDRYSPSKYLEIYKNEVKQLSEGKEDVYKVDTQVRLGKVRLGKDDKTNSDSAESPPLKRKEFTVPTETYKILTDAYKQYKGVELQGAEFGEVKRAIKTMLYSGRTKENILDFMKFCSEICELMKVDEQMTKQYCWLENWTILTIRRKMAEFLAGKFKIKEIKIPETWSVEKQLKQT